MCWYKHIHSPPRIAYYYGISFWMKNHYPYSRNKIHSKNTAEFFFKSLSSFTCLLICFVSPRLATFILQLSSCLETLNFVCPYYHVLILVCSNQYICTKICSIWEAVVVHICVHRCGIFECVDEVRILSHAMRPYDMELPSAITMNYFQWACHLNTNHFISCILCIIQKLSRFIYLFVCLLLVSFHLYFVWWVPWLLFLFALQNHAH